MCLRASVATDVSERLFFKYTSDILCILYNVVRFSVVVRIFINV